MRFGISIYQGGGLMAKVERDKATVKLVMRVAEEAASDSSILVIDRLTRLRAAICLGEEAGLNISRLKELESNLEKSR